MTQLDYSWPYLNDIRSYDENGQNHGYFETYAGDTETGAWLRVNYVHGKETGYEEYYGDCKTTFYIT